MRKHTNSAYRRKLVSVAVAACFAGRFAYANPVGPTVVSGKATITSQAGLLSVINTPGAIINWQQFSIDAAETTRFIQQSAASTVLNRVTGVDPSIILGTLQSNGRVFLVNPNGMFFGANARVDVAGLVASTLNISNEDFLAGRMRFAADRAFAAPVVNQGNITAAPGGRVMLIGSAVDNQGVISAPGGDIVLAAGKSVRVAEEGAPRLQVEIAAPEDRPLNLSNVAYGSRGIYSGLVRNSGTITANSVVQTADGRIVLKSSGDVAVVAGGSVTASGAKAGSIEIDAGANATVASTVEANGDASAGGTVSLKALIDTTLASGSRITANGSSGGSVTITAGGTASTAGAIEAKGDSGVGGQVAMVGDMTGIFDGARIDVSGATGGGSILAGGDKQGAFIFSGGQLLPNSRRTFVGRDTELRADAITGGDGGKIIVWSEDYSAFLGLISARGGANGGNGGFVETSSHQQLNASGLVNTSAPLGRAGLWLLDPTDMTITTSADANVSGATPFQPTASGSVLTWATINTALGVGNVSVQTTTGFNAGQSGNITIATAFAYNRANALTFTAANNIIVNGAVTNNGAGALTLTASGAGSVALNQNVTTTGGNITVTGGGGGVTQAGATTVNAGAGTISVNGGGGAINLAGALTTTYAAAVDTGRKARRYAGGRRGGQTGAERGQCVQARRRSTGRRQLCRSLRLSAAPGETAGTHVLVARHAQCRRLPEGDADGDDLHPESGQGMARSMKPRRPITGVYAALWLLAALPAGAQLASDPTRPPPAILLNTPGMDVQAGSPLLQSVMIGAGGRSAIIGGELVKLGGKYGDAKVVKITETEVVLRSSAGTETLHLYAGVEMKPVVVAPPAKAKPSAQKKSGTATNTLGTQK